VEHDSHFSHVVQIGRICGKNARHKTEIIKRLACNCFLCERGVHSGIASPFFFFLFFFFFQILIACSTTFTCPPANQNLGQTKFPYPKQHHLEPQFQGEVLRATHAHKLLKQTNDMYLHIHAFICLNVSCSVTYQNQYNHKHTPRDGKYCCS